MTKDDALKMALDAVATGGWKEVTEAATLIKEALAQQDAESHLQAVSDFGQLQEQEPLEYWNAVEGWVKIDEVHDHFDSVGCGTIYKTAGEDRVPLYTSLPKRQPLTDEALYEMLYGKDFIQFARAIEQAHGIGKQS
jgi:hypothetical protein